MTHMGVQLIACMYCSKRNDTHGRAARALTVLPSMLPP